MTYILHTAATLERTEGLAVQYLVQRARSFHSTLRQGISVV